MSKYSNYRSSIDELHRAYCKHRSETKKDRKKYPISDSLRDAISADPKFVTSLLGKLVNVEWNWLQSERIMVFPEDMDVCKSIYSGKYSVDHIDAIKPFANEFILNFPKDFVVDGYVLPSVMVSFTYENQYVNSRIQPMLDELGIPDIEEYVQVEDKPVLMVECYYRAFDQIEKNGQLIECILIGIILGICLKLEIYIRMVMLVPAVASPMR